MHKNRRSHIQPRFLYKSPLQAGPQVFYLASGSFARCSGRSSSSSSSICADFIQILDFVFSFFILICVSHIGVSILFLCRKGITTATFYRHRSVEGPFGIRLGSVRGPFGFRSVSVRRLSPFTIRGSFGIRSGSVRGC